MKEKLRVCSLFLFSFSFIVQNKKYFLYGLKVFSIAYAYGNETKVGNEIIKNCKHTFGIMFDPYNKVIVIIVPLRIK